MNCPDERTLSIHADGELGGEELRQVEFHLSQCTSCHRRWAALAEENRVLARAIEELVPDLAPASLPPRRARARTPYGLLAGGLLAGVAAGRLGMTVLARYVPRGGQWLNPLDYSGQVDLFFRSVFRVAEQGAGVLLDAMPLVAASCLLCGAAVSLAALSRSRPQPAVR